jgi:hypothetical protein
MTRLPLLVACIATFIFTLSGCNKDEDAVPLLNKMVVDQIIWHTNVDQIGKNVYDAEGRIIRYDYYFNGSRVEYVEYSYQSNALTLRKVYDIDLDGKFVLSGTDEMTYNSSHQLVSIKRDRLYMKNEYALTYDGNHVKKMAYSTQFNGGTTDYSYYLYEYDAKGNVSKRTSYSIANETEIVNSITTYQYDEKVNPQAGFMDPGVVIENEGNANNITGYVMKTENGQAIATYEIAYTYNEQNLPLTRTETIITGNQTTQKEIKYLYKKI